VQAAIGGQAPGNLYEDGSDRHFPMMVRLAAPYRQKPRCDPAHPIGAPIRTATAT
jgi:heavy metal efflux system protein